VPYVIVKADAEKKYRAQNRVGENIGFFLEAFGPAHGDYFVVNGNSQKKQPRGVPYVPKKTYDEIRRDDDYGIREKIPVI
jgi:rRNA processing protein Gar1